MSDGITGSAVRHAARGRAIGLVAFLFGLTGRETLPGPVLRHLLGDLGLSPDGSRALLARMRRQGMLAGQRRGREVDYRLDGEFAVGFRRVRDQSMTTVAHWPGHFHAVLYQVPESDRSYRDALRRAAVLAGYGVLQHGVLIAPHDRARVFADLLDDPPPAAQVRVARLGMDAEEAARAASTAWDLPGLAQTYREHTHRLVAGAETHRARLAAREVVDPAVALMTYAQTLQPALTDTLREPGLPPGLMPADWPGDELRTAIGTFAGALSETTAPYLHGLLEAS